MKPKPTERMALDKARTITPLSMDEAAAIASLPDLQTFARRHHRLRLAETRLAWAAEEWQRRELRLSLYRYAQREGNRSEITHQRVTTLDTPTKRIRNALTYAFQNLQRAESATLRLF